MWYLLIKMNFVLWKNPMTEIVLNFEISEPSKVESLSERKSLEQVQQIQTAQAAALEKKHLEKEKWYSVTVQVAVPFFIAGIGTIGAGVVLGNVTVSVTFPTCDSYRHSETDLLH